MSVWRGFGKAEFESAFHIVPVIKSKLYEYEVSLDHESLPLHIYVPFSGPPVPLRLFYLPLVPESKFRQLIVPDFYPRVASRRPKSLRSGIVFCSVDAYVHFIKVLFVYFVSLRLWKNKMCVDGE